jgi:hypothetical protein
MYYDKPIWETMRLAALEIKKLQRQADPGNYASWKL